MRQPAGPCCEPVHTAVRLACNCWQAGLVCSCLASALPLYGVRTVKAAAAGAAIEPHDHRVCHGIALAHNQVVEEMDAVIAHRYVPAVVVGGQPGHEGVASKQAACACG